MQFKESINKLIQRNNEVKQFIEAANRKSADEAIIGYTNYLEQSNYNSALSLSFACALQLGSDPRVYKQYELKDIERLFDSLIELNEGCINLYTDAANFADAVMDDKTKAKKIVEFGIDKLKAKLENLQQLSDSITSE